MPIQRTFNQYLTQDVLFKFYVYVNYGKLFNYVYVSGLKIVYKFQPLTGLIYKYIKVRTIISLYL